MAPPKTKSTTTPTAAAMKTTTKPMPKKLKKRFQELEILERLQGIAYIKVLLGNDRPKEDDYVFLARGSPALMRSCRLRSKHLRKVVYEVYNDMTWELTGIFIPINVLAMAQQGVQKNDTFRKRKAEKTTSNEPAKKQKGQKDAVDAENGAEKEESSEEVDMDKPTRKDDLGEATNEEAPKESDLNEIAAPAESEAAPKDIVMEEADPGKPVPDGSTGNIIKEAAVADLTNESAKATDDTIPRDISNKAGTGKLAGAMTENTPKNAEQETEGITTKNTPKAIDQENSVTSQALIDAQLAEEMNLEAKQDVSENTNGDACPLYEVVSAYAENSTENSSAIPRSLETDEQDAIDNSAREGELQEEVSAATSDANPVC